MKSESCLPPPDPRVGLVCFLAVLGFVVALPVGASFWKSAALLFWLLVAGLLFTPQPAQFWKKLRRLLSILITFLAFLLAITLPVSKFISKEPAGQTLFYFGQIVLRALIVVVADLVFILSQKSEDLLAALSQAKMPSVLIQLLNSGLRYSQIFAEEATDSFRARLARETGARPFFEKLKTTGLIIEKIFWRVIDRSGRVYAAMLSRGYDGHLYFHKKFKLRFSDIFLLSSFLAALVILSLI